MASRRATSSFVRSVEGVSQARRASLSLRGPPCPRPARSASSLCPTAVARASFADQRPLMPRLRQPKRHFTTSLVARRDDSHTASSPPPSTLFTFAEIQAFTQSPDPKRILVDVREPAELQASGKIPGSYNVPIGSSPEAFFLPAEEFEERFGWPKPDQDDEVIFYCKAGVRSKAAAQLAAQAGFGGKIGEFPGSWLEWERQGGEKETVK